MYERIDFILAIQTQGHTHFESEVWMVHKLLFSFKILPAFASSCMSDLHLAQTLSVRCRAWLDGGYYAGPYVLADETHEPDQSASKPHAYSQSLQ